MAHDSARAERSSRFHSKGSERGHAAPAADFAVSSDADDFDDVDDYDRNDRNDRYDGSANSLADDLIDDLLPPEVDWRQIVRRHPVPALLFAGVGGYLLGRSQGRKLLTALSALAVARVESEVLGRIEDELD